jgi:hypothetical protein
VDRVLSGNAEFLTGGRAFVELPMAPAQSVEEFQQALPTVRCLLFLVDVTHHPYPDIENNDSGRPPDSRLFSVSPQGFWVDQAGSDLSLLDHGEVAAWGEIDTIEEISSALAAGGATAAP